MSTRFTLQRVMDSGCQHARNQNRGLTNVGIDLGTDTTASSLGLATLQSTANRTDRDGPWLGWRMARKLCCILNATSNFWFMGNSSRKYWVQRYQSLGLAEFSTSKSCYPLHGVGPGRTRGRSRFQSGTLSAFFVCFHPWNITVEITTPSV